MKKILMLLAILSFAVDVSANTGLKLMYSPFDGLGVGIGYKRFTAAVMTDQWHGDGLQAPQLNSVSSIITMDIPIDKTSALVIGGYQREDNGQVMSLKFRSVETAFLLGGSLDYSKNLQVCLMAKIGRKVGYELVKSDESVTPYSSVYSAYIAYRL